ncbi:MAG: PQQ-dependent dehydrogenase, methanol/ethanol family [Bryobacterales bacterium]|nr:PQQ-dependent dehydrogenase, methanol/ethanol family [Bryobacterales bacterium]
MASVGARELQGGARVALCVLLFLLVPAVPAQELEGTRKQFQALCAHCHGLDGAGGERGPSLLRRTSRTATLEAVRDVIRKGVTSGGMPAFPLPEQQLAPLAAYVFSMSRRRGERPPPRAITLPLSGGREIRGLVRNESNYDLQLEGADGRLYLFERAGAGWRQVMPDPQGEWPTYHGVPGGNRHSPLRQIHTGNVAALAPRWIFTIPDSRRLEVTPIVADGIMYITGANQAYALDPRTGREIWHYQRPRTPGLAGDAAGGINRGAAIWKDRLFFVTDNARLLALNRATGALIWDVEMADHRQNYGATSAPLVAGDLVISGTSGGDEGVRGFLAAYHAATGEQAWRVWTIPAPGEPGSETWIGKALEHGCGAAWLTGTYDPSTGMLYWPTGNPCPDYNGDERKGDNLYTSSVLALDVATGKRRWYYQFTPHDVHDWDAQQTPMLVDADFRGRPRKLLVQANRNGFFYVLDRLSGELLLAKPFVKRLTWAGGIGPDGRPQVLPGTDPSPQGTKVCPAVEGATNWMSTAYHPETGLFYVMALEKCNIYFKEEAVWEPGKSHYGGGTRNVPGEPGRKYLRALNIQTGETVWEYPQTGPANTWGGVLSTGGGLVFFGDDSGAFAAVDARTGKPLWHFHTSQTWKASPMTYLAGGKQYVAIASGSNVIAFSLP